MYRAPVRGPPDSCMLASDLDGRLLSPGTRLVLCILWRYAPYDEQVLTPFVWPDLDEVIRLSGLAPRACKRCLSTLVQANWISERVHATTRAGDRFGWYLFRSGGGDRAVTARADSDRSVTASVTERSHMYDRTVPASSFRTTRTTTGSTAGRRRPDPRSKYARARALAERAIALNPPGATPIRSHAAYLKGLHELLDGAPAGFDDHVLEVLGAYATIIARQEAERARGLPVRTPQLGWWGPKMFGVIKDGEYNVSRWIEIERIVAASTRSSDEGKKRKHEQQQRDTAAQAEDDAHARPLSEALRGMGVRGAAYDRLLALAGADGSDQGGAAGT